MSDPALLTLTALQAHLAGLAQARALELGLTPRELAAQLYDTPTSRQTSDVARQLQGQRPLTGKVGAQLLDALGLAVWVPVWGSPRMPVAPSARPWLTQAAAGRNPDVALAAQVRARAGELGVTQEALALHVLGRRPDGSIPRGTVSRYLGGHVGLLTSNGLALMNALGLQTLKAQWRPASSASPRNRRASAARSGR